MRILFAVPSYAGLTDSSGKPRCPQFMQSLANTLELARARGHEPLYVQVTGNCYIQMARNDLTVRIFTENADVIMFLDDDLEWKAEDCLKLCEMEDEVVAGIYRMKTVDRSTAQPIADFEEYPVVIPTNGQFRPIVRKDGCILANDVPTGFLAIKRSVIEKLIAVHPERKYVNYDREGKPEAELYDLFPQGIRDGRMWGEDFAFCHLWRSTGGQIWIVPNLDLTHWRGTLPYHGNYHKFLLRQPGGSNDERMNHEQIPTKHVQEV